MANNSSLDTFNEESLTMKNLVLSDRIIGVLGMIIINTLAFWGNLVNIIAILSKYHLRQNMANILVLNLCTAEILSSALILPFAIVSFYAGTWIFGNILCSFVGFLGSLFTFASITNVCAISIERYYSIKFPMHHAAHMSLPKTVSIISFIWAESFLMSMLPLIGVNSYSFQHHEKQCSFSTELDSTSRVYVVAVGLLFFVIPCVILFIMYWGIFRVAHQAGHRINPEIARVSVNDINQNISNIPNFITQDSPEAASTMSSPPGRIQLRAPRRHLKAAKTLMIILTAFIILWGPYFIYYSYGVINGNVEHRHVREVLLVWLGYCAFAINPFLYGFMNRAIRLEILNIYKSIFYCRYCVEQGSGDEQAGNEDFLQFLEGTSSRMAVVNNGRLPCINITNPTVCDSDNHTSSEL